MYPTSSAKSCAAWASSFFRRTQVFDGSWGCSVQWLAWSRKSRRETSKFDGWLCVGTMWVLLRDTQILECLLSKTNAKQKGLSGTHLHLDRAPRLQPVPGQIFLWCSTAELFMAIFKSGQSFDTHGKRQGVAWAAMAFGKPPAIEQLVGKWEHNAGQIAAESRRQHRDATHGSPCLDHLGPRLSSGGSFQKFEIQTASKFIQRRTHFKPSARFGILRGCDAARTHGKKTLRGSNWQKLVCNLKRIMFFWFKTVAGFEAETKPVRFGFPARPRGVQSTDCRVGPAWVNLRKQNVSAVQSGSILCAPISVCPQAWWLSVPKQSNSNGSESIHKFIIDQKSIYESINSRIHLQLYDAPSPSIQKWRLKAYTKFTKT